MSRPSFSLLLLLLPLSLFAAGQELSTAPVRQLRPVMTANGAGFAAAWIEESAGGQVAVAGSTSGEGEPLGGSGTVLDQKYSVSVAVAHGSSEALVVWSAFDSILAARLTAFNVRLDTEPITITGKATSGAINVTSAWDGSRYLVVWSGYEGLFGSFVGVDGSVTSPRLIVSALGASQPDVAWDGHQFLLAFSVTDDAGPLCSPCQTLPPREVRLLRVAADGTSTDTALVVPGAHIRAHVASSGSEFLVTLDSLTNVALVTVSSDGGTMRLGDEVALFRWFTSTSSASSDVAWDGGAYAIGWRYTALAQSWLATSRVSRSGQPSSPLVIAGGRPDSRPDFSYTAWEPSLAVAVNDAGQTALIASDAASSSEDIRARIYYASEFTPMPAPPPAPRNVVSYVSGNTARIEWQSDDAPGFLIERSFDSGMTWPVSTEVPGNARNTTVTLYTSLRTLFRVSAFGPGGLSQAGISSIGNQPRRHASH